MRIDGATVARHAVSSVALAGLTIAVIVFVVARWRDRELIARLAGTDDPPG